MLGVEAMAERMGHDVVGHHPLTATSNGALYGSRLGGD